MKKRVRKKSFQEKINLLLSLVIIAILLPLFITIICQRMRLEQVIYGEQGTPGENAAEAAQIEEQVLYIVAREININAEPAAIRAQCIIARTNLYDAREHGTAEPEALDMTELQELWGAGFEKNYHSLRAYVEQTEHQVLTWEGDYIYAAYHAISAGRTRDMAELYEDAAMPYLTKRLCQEDTTAEGYLAVSYWETEKFLEECRERFPEAALNTVSEIVILSRDETGYVGEVRVGNETCPGEEFRSRWGLNSACFTITEEDDKVRIVTKGLGHGFGLSQHMAEHMASQGQSCAEILQYFYPGTELADATLRK